VSNKLCGFYVSFSGESGNPIDNVYALAPEGGTPVSYQVLDTGRSYKELRGMVFGPDGNLYVAQSHKEASAILQFSGTLASGSHTRKFLKEFAAPAASGGLLHPYHPAFGPDGNLYVSSQDTNVVSSFYGPLGQGHDRPGQATPVSSFLPKGTYYAGTFAPARSAEVGIPPNTPVPVDQGGLTFATAGGTRHSVRGIAFDSVGNLYVADEGNDRVAVFGPGGNFLGAIAQSKSHSLDKPVALCFDAATNTLYIGSPGNQRLFTYDASLVGRGDLTANMLISDSKLDKLSGIAVDPDGNIHTGNRKDNAIYQWSPNGDTFPHKTFAGPFGDSPERIIAVHSAIVGM
jgi:hypothetical protein